MSSKRRSLLRGNAPTSPDRYVADSPQSQTQTTFSSPQGGKITVHVYVGEPAMLIHLQQYRGDHIPCSIRTAPTVVAAGAFNGRGERLHSLDYILSHPKNIYMKINTQQMHIYDIPYDFLGTT